MKQWKSPVPRKRRNEGLVALTNFINGGLSVVKWTLKVAEKEAKKSEAKNKTTSKK